MRCFFVLFFKFVKCVECAGKGVCWASQSHQAESSFVIVTKKSTLRKAIQNIVCCLFWLLLFLLLSLFSICWWVLLSHCGCNDLFKCKNYMKRKETWTCDYIWVEVHLNCRPVLHKSLETHETKNGTFKLSYIFFSFFAIFKTKFHHKDFSKYISFWVSIVLQDAL